MSNDDDRIGPAMVTAILGDDAPKHGGDFAGVCFLLVGL